MTHLWFWQSQNFFIIIIADYLCEKVINPKFYLIWPFTSWFTAHTSLALKVIFWILNFLNFGFFIFYYFLIAIQRNQLLRLIPTHSDVNHLKMLQNLISFDGAASQPITKLCFLSWFWAFLILNKFWRLQKKSTFSS